MNCAVSAELSMNYSRIYLKPGDAVRIEPKIRQPDILLAKWNRPFYWETRHKDGKDWVIVKHHETVTGLAQARFGAQIKVEVRFPDGEKQHISAGQPVEYVAMAPGEMSFRTGVVTGAPNIPKPHPHARPTGSPCAVWSSIGCPNRLKSIGRFLDHGIELICP